jgi:hypothetical protein
VVAGAVGDETEGCDELPSLQVVADDGIRGDCDPDAGRGSLEGQVEALQGLLGGGLYFHAGDASAVVPCLRSCVGVQKGYLRYADGAAVSVQALGEASHGSCFWSSEDEIVLASCDRSYKAFGPERRRLGRIAMVFRRVVWPVVVVDAPGVCPGRASDAGVCSLRKGLATAQVSLENGQFNQKERTMALSQSDLLRLLESLRTADGVETIRVLCERILQELIEADATEVIGAAPGEHSDQRKTWRNGHRDRLLTTQAGDLDLRIPKVRTGSFFPSLLERRRRIDRALFAVVMEAYVHGVSTRSVDDLVKALGADSGISKSRGVADLRRAGCGADRVQRTPAGPHRLPLCVPGRHSPAKRG